MKIAVVCGKQGDGIKRGLMSVKDSLVIDVFYTLADMQSNSLQRQYYVDRIIMSSVVLKGKEDKVLRDLHTFLKENSPRTQVILLCSSTNERDKEISAKFSLLFNSPLFTVVPVDTPTMTTLVDASNMSIEQLQSKYGAGVNLNLEVDEDVYEIKKEEPVQVAEVVDVPKRKGFLGKLFGSKKVDKVVSTPSEVKEQSPDEDDKMAIGDSTQQSEELNLNEELDNNQSTSSDNCVEIDEQLNDEFSEEEVDLSAETEPATIQEQIADFEDEYKFSDLSVAEPSLDGLDTTESGFAKVDVESNDLPTEGCITASEDLLVFSEVPTAFKVESSNFNLELDDDNTSSIASDINGEEEIDFTEYEDDVTNECIPAEDTACAIEDSSNISTLSSDVAQVEDLDLGSLPIPAPEPTLEFIPEPVLDQVEDTELGVLGSTESDYWMQTKEVEVVEKIKEVEKIVEVEKVVEKVKEVEKIVEVEKVKEVFIDKTRSSVVDDILNGKTKSVIIVTGDRGSGVTTTALQIAEFFSDKVHVLLVDSDVQKHGLMNYLDYNEVRKFDTTQLQGFKLCRSQKTFDSSVIRLYKNMDVLTSNFGVDITDRDIVATQEVIPSIADSYGVVVIDVPLDYLHLYEDVLLIGTPILCVEASKRGFMNVLCNLEEDLIPQRYKRSIANKGAIALTKVEDNFSLKDVKSYVYGVVDFEGVDWLSLPILSKEQGVDANFLNSVLER